MWEPIIVKVTVTTRYQVFIFFKSMCLYGWNVHLYGLYTCTFQLYKVQSFIISPRKKVPLLTTSFVCPFQILDFTLIDEHVHDKIRKGKLLVNINRHQKLFD